MRLIDADALEELFREVIGSLSRRTDCNLNFEYMIRPSAMTIEMIKDAPTIDAVEVVRCKDCKFWQNQEEGVIEVPICARPKNKYEKLPFRFMIGEDGFCSFAERRSDGAD